MKRYFDKIFENNMNETIKELINSNEISELIIDLIPNYKKLTEKEIITLKSIILLMLLMYSKVNFKIIKE